MVRRKRSTLQKIVEGSGTLFFSFQDLDVTKLAGSVKIRVEIVACYLERSSAAIIAAKKLQTKGRCPLLSQAV
jgi:hypothetical protein